MGIEGRQLNHPFSVAK